MELAWDFCGYWYKNIFLGVHTAALVLQMEFINLLSVISSCWLQWEMELLSALKVLDFCCSAVLLKLSTQRKIPAKVVKLLIMYLLNLHLNEVFFSLLQHNFLVYSTFIRLFPSISYFRKKENKRKSKNGLKKKKRTISLLTKLKCP